MRFLSFLLAFLLGVTATGDVRDAESVKKWNEDLEYFRIELPRRHHRDFLFDLPREEFNRLVDAVKGDIPKLQDHEIKVRLAAIVAKLGDRHGHTRVALNNASAGFHVLPVNFYVYTDGLFIRAIAKQHAIAAGARVLRIGNVAAADALARVLTITAGDNDMSRRSYAQELLAVPEILRALHIVSGGEPNDPVTVDVEQLDGTRATITLAAQKNYDGIEWADVRSAAKAQPLSRKYPPANPAAEYIPAKPYWFEFLPDAKVLYVNYSSVADSPGQTLEAFFDSVFAFADANPVEKLVIDVRKNGGGNNMLNRSIFTDIAQHDSTFGRHGRLFVLIGRDTFSAAQNFVNFLAANTNAIFAGEPTGGSPNHYGDSTRLTLPNSRLIVRAATLWWQDGHPAERRTWIAPHIAAELSSADDRSGRDPALDAVIQYKPEPALYTRLREAVLQGGKAEAEKAWRAWRDDARRKYADAEETMTNVAVVLFGENKQNEAVMMFELNAEAHPRSAAAWEALGRAYQGVNRRDDAIAAYEKALAVDPRAVTVLDRIERLRMAPR